MSLKSSPIGSGEPSSPPQMRSQEGTLSAPTGERNVKTLSAKSKCAIVAFVVGGVAGIIIIGLGASNIFGSIGSSGFIGSIAGGGAVAVFSVGGIIWIALTNCKAESGPSRKNTESLETHDNIDSIGVPLKDKTGKTYPRIGQEAIEFARQKLSEQPDTPKTIFETLQGAFAGGTNQPINQEIALLTTLYWDVYFTKFKQKIQEHKDANPWSQSDVIQAADDLIKIGYAITCLTLEDLPEFTQALEAKGTKRTYAEALTIQDSYQYRTYYLCSWAYHWMRGGAVWLDDDQEDNKGHLDYTQETSKTHADPFYQENTIQSKWRMLYNDHCDRIRSYVNESDLQRADNRHFTWTKKDEDTFFKGRTFFHTPDSLPT